MDRIKPSRLVSALALAAGLTACGSAHPAGLTLSGETARYHTWEGEADDTWGSGRQNCVDGPVGPGQHGCWTPFKLHLSSFSPIKGEIRWFKFGGIDAKDGMPEMCRGTWTETQKLPDGDSGFMVRVVHEHVTSVTPGETCNENDWKLEIINKTGSYSSELQDSLKPGIFGGGDAIGTGMGGFHGTDLTNTNWTLGARGFIDEVDFEK
jgi:hypothetical protein